MQGLFEILFFIICIFLTCFCLLHNKNYYGEYNIYPNHKIRYIGGTKYLVKY